ncbi:helix-turn-helix domain-containing protein [Streptomyces sp. AP-93]|uniref:helix-turn-helix domain-containing protein n=1 Tax=Streptomyces sp. AP-93 TaxID=2929048 RepID=UPI001FAE8269|nr:helix-turn-helix domain-containing protein [Streptomyces sp. AP-93]MCJ0873548.1 helix-turn-helix domain-containing protein [Streptomyces sp. AP-93]
MRIHLSPRKRAFTVLGNEVVRDRRLSFTARGILCYLLSLPDGSREDVRTLADKHPGVGRRGVSKAVDELVRYGYYARRTVRDPLTGHVHTETFVSDTPPTEDRPQPPGAGPDPTPGTGEGVTGRAGASPQGTKTSGEVPSLPEALEALEPLEAPEAPPSPEPPGTVGQSATQGTARGAALLARITAYEPRLRLGVTETLALAPLAQRWLEHGVSDLEARCLLTDGLPPFVYSARALLADRLVRKLPAPRAPRDPAAPAAPPAECGVCRDPLPAPDAHCGQCAGALTAPRGGLPSSERVASLADIARRALRGLPALA